jgi:hypothetical protein
VQKRAIFLRQNVSLLREFKIEAKFNNSRYASSRSGRKIMISKKTRSNAAQPLLRGFKYYVLMSTIFHFN